jgi:hypothetical protein
MSKKRSTVLLFAGILGGTAGLGCKGSTDAPSDDSGVLPGGVESIIFLQRVARSGTGNVFDYTSFRPGGKIVRLSPPSADGTLTNLTAGPIFDGADFMSWDLSYDARTIVFSARLKDDSHYQLYTMGVDGSNPQQITEGPDHYVYPVFVPGQRVMFMTSKSVEPGAKQFSDEYERQTTTQVGIINMNGTAETLGPRNLSHRVAPAVLPNGSVVYTEWRHLGVINDGHLRVMNADMTGMREAFGGEGNGVTNSYLKARFAQEITSPGGNKTYRLITVATSREETLQSGKLILVDLNDDERTSKSTDLTPLVPGGEEPSQPNIGRYYDAEPVDAVNLKFLVSWADGPVQAELLEEAKTEANFGVYLFDGKTGRRFPVWDDPRMWDVMARPVAPRTEPAVTPTPVMQNEKSFVLGALNVYESSVANIPAGSAIKVRLLEGFSSEEGFPNMFGLTEFDGQSLYGEVPVNADGSFAAKVPANTPLHMQVIDKFAMAVASEDIWISGRPGEQRFCGGCHESRSKLAPIAPGLTENVLRGAVNLDVPRAERISMDFSYEKIKGVPWNLAIQPIFDAKCIGCHDGDAAKPGNTSYTVTDRTLMTSQTFTFDLRGQKIALMVGEEAGDYEWPASYVSLMGLGEALGENVVEITGNRVVYVEPGSARASLLFKKINPPQRFPSVDENVRAFPGPQHPADVGGQALTPEEYYRLILNVDMGGQFYSRENKGY